jgi:hypothetical protein
MILNGIKMNLEWLRRIDWSEASGYADWQLIQPQTFENGLEAS